MHHFKTLALRSSATLALLGALSFSAQAQVSVTDDTSAQTQTSAAGAPVTGILISGASPFQGNIEIAESSAVDVEGNDSFVNLANTPMMTDGLTGNLTTTGQIGDGGSQSVGVNLASNAIGNVTNENTITANGAGLEAYVATGDIQGGFVNNSNSISTGFITQSINSANTFITGGISDATLDLADPNTLVVTLDLRDSTSPVAKSGLGLDAVQASTSGAIANGLFQSGDVLQILSSSSALGNAFSNITDPNEFFTAYNQILPEFSGAALRFIQANVDGAIGAVSSHLDTTRRSPEKPGGAWLQEYFYFADRELAGGSEQFRGEGFGFAGGLDTAFGPFHAVGVNVGFASTEIEDVVGIDRPLDVRTFLLGTYAGYQTGKFNLDLYGGVGLNEFKQNRRIEIDNFVGDAEGEWDGIHANASARAGYSIPLSKTFWARPSVSVDYLYLDEDGHTETGTDGFRLGVEGRTTETAAATAMLDIGAKLLGKRTWIRPSIRAGYRNEFLSDPTETQFRFQGLQDTNGNLFDSELAELRAFAFPDEAIILGFTIAAGTQYSSIGFDFDSDIRDGFIRHTGRIVVRLIF